jgi:D-amino peptidase
MKIYISADIEGVTGVTDWDETKLNKPDHYFAQEQMTAEVIAACEGALSTGATEIWVKDAHDSGRNLIASRLPKEIRLIRGWSGHPYMMVQELDKSFDCMMMIGYHSRSGAGTNPLSHTFTPSVNSVTINNRLASEFLINGYVAAYEKVPLVFVSGDQGLCDEIHTFAPDIRSVAVKYGIGKSTINIQPALATSMIRDGVANAIKDVKAIPPIVLPSHFMLAINYKEHYQAFRNSFYPGASLSDSKTLNFETDNYFEVMRLLLFLMEDV